MKMSATSPWKKPDEIMQLHKLKKKKRALQKRMSQSATTLNQNSTVSGNFGFTNSVAGEKRKNPFSKSIDEDKRLKTDDDVKCDESLDRTLFVLLNVSKQQPAPSEQLSTEKLSTFSNMLQKYNQENVVHTEAEVKRKYLPIDWSLKTKVRIVSPKPFAWDLKLKASEEASGITGFVRCLDTAASASLDSSHPARFHQHCQYWQHPHLPWLQLFPRSSGKGTTSASIAANETVASALRKEWTESFRSLFQLVRARQCPYFYVCGNAMTCVFRAPGLCGVSETCALIAPTTRGFRHMLKQEDIEFTMPLRPNRRSKSSDGQEEAPGSLSQDSCCDTPDDREALEGSGSGSEDDSDRFLSQLGLETDLINKINNTQVRVERAAESAVDRAPGSLVAVRGVDAQALFNCLLNCRSLAGATGALAGVPPTLLAPTAFHGGTLQTLQVRHSIITCEQSKYHSLQLVGPVLPSALHALLAHVRATAHSFSATCAALKHTDTFSAPATTTALAAEEVSKENAASSVPNAFNTENLSDCGLSKSILQHFCSSDPAMVATVDALKYSSEDDAFVWS